MQKFSAKSKFRMFKYIIAKRLAWPCRCEQGEKSSRWGE